MYSNQLFINILNFPYEPEPFQINPRSILASGTNKGSNQLFRALLYGTISQLLWMEMPEERVESMAHS